jgi:hypothetical protein
MTAAANFHQLRDTTLGHPSRQQRACAVGLVDDKVDLAAMLKSTHHGNAFARARMERVSDQNVKRLFLGSISQSRRRHSAERF